MLFFRVLLFVSIFYSTAFGDAKHFYFERSLLENTVLDKQESAKEYWFEQRIQHNNADNSNTFSQRFYVDDQFANSSDAPIFFYLCGEGVCTPRILSGQIAEHAKVFGAVLVALEHRYYGKSLPFDQLSAENLKYLTVDYALKDAAFFQDHFNITFNYKGKWIAIGGSYPGNLSAAFRLRYPDRVVGSLASSAPVFAKENFEEYDAHVTKVAGPACVKNLRRMVSVAEAAMKKPNEWAVLKSSFEASDIENDIDVLYLIADISAAAVQYGMKDEFCQSIESPDVSAGYSEFARKLYRNWGMKAVDFTFQSAISEDPDDYTGGFAMRQWLYQSCTEYGYWQAAHHDPELSSRSKLIDLAYHRDACKRLFGLTEPAKTQKTNQHFYYPLLLLSTSHILFTNGSDDPWSTLSLNPESASQNPNINFFMIDGAAHCDDLRTSKPGDSLKLKESRSLFRKLAKNWLE